MSLIELAIGITILTIGMGWGVYSLLGAMTLRREAGQRSTALQAAQSTIEALQGAPFAEVFARFNATPGDDPALGASPGDAFPVPGLDAWQGDPDGLPGEILFPGDGVGLFENVVNADLGMPRDLTLDDPPLIDNVDHSGDYRILPVLVSVRWRGPRGNQTLVMGTTLNNERKTP